jgi:tRNA G18 (ribose-2'-O)-methylase SpoU
MVRQLIHSEIKNNIAGHQIVVVLDNLSSHENIGMIFRLCEAMGVSKLFLCGKTPRPVSIKAIRAARATIEKVDYEHVGSVVDCVVHLKSEDYALVGLEITNTSSPIQQTHFAPTDKIGIVIGSERSGICHEALGKCDKTVHIPMYGVNTSMNVVQALAIALYEATNQMNG